MASSENAISANEAEPLLRALRSLCTDSVLPNQLTIDERNYAITDENRKEIEEDFMNHTNLPFDFAEKWKASYVGPAERFASQPAQKKPTTPFEGIDEATLKFLYARSLLRNHLSVNGRDYVITDKNRKEIEEDFENQANLTFDFAEKWKASYIGPTKQASSQLA